MIIHKSFKYELKPNNKQVSMFIKHCGVARFAWNWGLNDRENRFQNGIGKERYTNYCEQNKKFNHLKQTEFPWVYDVSKCVGQESLKDLDKAYNNFYKNHKSRHVGLPKFKKKGKHDAFRVNHRVYVRDNCVQLPRIGLVRIKESTNKFCGKLLFATVYRDVDRWFCNICVSMQIEPQNNITNIIGIDFGLRNYVVISDGHEFTHIKAPKPLNINIKKLKYAHKRLRRRVHNSRNYLKEKTKLLRLYRKLRNQRADFIHKLTSKLARTTSAIIVEDLNLAGMIRNHKMARAIVDVNFRDFVEKLRYKTNWYGSNLIKVGRFEPTSKSCSNCGSINHELKLSDRIWICENCGITHDRDENAAINIRNEGIRILNTGSSSGIQACGESVSPSLNKAVLAETGNKHIKC